MHETKSLLVANDNADILYTRNIARVGQPIGALFGFRSAGVNPANGNPMWFTADGRTIQGNPDDNSYYLYNPENPTELVSTAALSQEDKVVLGQTNPKVFGGLTNNLRYKNFDLGLTLTYAFGQKVYNGTRQDGLTNFFTNNLAEIKDRWTLANPNTHIPRLSLDNDNFTLNDGEAVSTFVENGDYVRIQNITIGYSLPSRILNGTNIENVRFYSSVQNAFVFTGYKGLDPELNFSPTTNVQAGIDLNTNPLLRTITFGINATF